MGAGMQVAGPWGPRPQVYADWAASGRALGPVEDFVRARVLPAYGNTHTTTSAAGLQTSCFRLEARQAVAQARPKPFPLRPAGCPKRAPAPVALNVPRRSPRPAVGRCRLSTLAHITQIQPPTVSCFVARPQPSPQP